ncbi:MAG TPA: hypothetical protein VMK65_07985 [Longimicrobiales bacterium]|nr:hypothetical protein [Longimicrobiales bacterium]
MNVVLFIFLMIFIGAPIAKAVAERISRDGLPGEKPDPALRARLAETESRLLANEERLQDVEERLEFYERLLANPDNRERVRTGRPR